VCKGDLWTQSSLSYPVLLSLDVRRTVMLSSFLADHRVCSCKGAKAQRVSVKLIFPALYLLPIIVFCT